MARPRTIKPAGAGKKEGAAFAVWFRLNEKEIAVLERRAKSENLTLKELLTNIAVQAIERRAKAEMSN
jgi:hypothetical protein